jgi:hypothetical protein
MELMDASKLIGMMCLSAHYPSLLSSLCDIIVVMEEILLEFSLSLLAVISRGYTLVSFIELVTLGDTARLNKYRAERHRLSRLSISRYRDVFLF